MCSYVCSKPVVDAEPEEKAVKLYVTMVGWSTDDLYVVTAVSDHTIKVWNSYTGKLHHVLKVNKTWDGKNHRQKYE